MWAWLFTFACPIEDDSMDPGQLFFRVEQNWIQPCQEISRQAFRCLLKMGKVWRPYFYTDHTFSPLMVTQFNMLRERMVVMAGDSDETIMWDKNLWIKNLTLNMAFFMVDASLLWDGMKETEGSVRFKSEDTNACNVQVPHQPHNRSLHISSEMWEWMCWGAQIH